MVSTYENSLHFLNMPVEQCDFLDVGKYKSKGRRLWFTHFQAASHERLDIVYISVCLDGCVNHNNVKRVSFTDHYLGTD